MTLKQKATALREMLKNDRNIQAIGVREISPFNPEETLCIYTNYPFKPGTYPEVFEDVKVIALHVGIIEIKGPD